MAAAGQDQVRGLDVAVDDRRVLRVQERQRLGGLGEVGEHARGRQAGRAPLGQDPREVGAVDPVHRDDVLVLHEEVLTDSGRAGCGCEAEQQAGLTEQLLARLLATAKCGSRIPNQAFCPSCDGRAQTFALHSTRANQKFVSSGQIPKRRRCC